MRRALLACSTALFWALLVGCGDDGQAGDDAGDDILDELEAIDGVTSVEEVFPEEPEEGLRYFDIFFEQPLDHGDPAAGTWEQYGALIHRDADAPMVVYTSGYGAGRLRYRGEIAAALDANQLSLEYRFFAQSVPDASPAEWELLTVEQAADDFHAVTGMVRPLYPASWLHTGGSKGGVTALFSRYLYPDDVDATVAYVAPIMTGQPDERFAGIFDRIGDPDCSTRLRAAGRAIAEQKAAMTTRAAEVPGDSYDLLGVDFATEVAIIELEWSFWQYAGILYCNGIPDATADEQTLWEFLTSVSPPSGYADASMLDTYQPFVVQAMSELGYPRFDYPHIADLITIDYQDLSVYLPEGVPAPSFDPTLAEELIDWAATDATEVMLIYGEWDPWSGGAIDVNPDNDSLRIDVAEGSHWSANIGFMTADQQADALGALERWTGVPAVLPTSARASFLTADPADRRRVPRGSSRR